MATEVHRFGRYTVATTISHTAREPIVVVFGPERDVDKALRDLFGSGTCLAENADFIHISSAVDDWYQGDIDDALSFCSETINGRRSVGFGVSMGAYAVLNFQNALRLNTFVVANPQYSIDWRKAPWETRWRKEAGHVDFARDHLSSVRSGRGGIIFVSGRRANRAHAKALAEHHLARLVWIDRFEDNVAFLGENGVAASLRTDAGSSLVRSALRGLIEGDRQTFDRTTRQARQIDRQSNISLLSLSIEAYGRKHFRASVEVAKRSFEKSGGKHFPSVAHYANLLWQDKRPDEAAAFLRKWVDHPENGIHAQHWLKTIGALAFPKN